MEERTGEAFAFDEQLTVVGRKLQPGGVAPDFLLDYLDLIEMTIQSARLADSTGMVRLLRRAVFVVGRDDHIAYAEYRADQMGEPDYAAAIEAARQRACMYGA